MPWKLGQTKNWHFAKAGAWYANGTKRHIRRHTSIPADNKFRLAGTDTTVLATPVDYPFIVNPLLRIDGTPSEGAAGDWLVAIPNGRYPALAIVSQADIAGYLEVLDADGT